ncbi:MAG: hypothetical protein AAF539_14665, partial [Planctomycetota bacterium]
MPTPPIPPAEAQTISPLATSRSLVADPIYLVNAAFLQEIKDSHGSLWHLTHETRCLCDFDENDRERPQAVIKQLVVAMDELRDLLALQFSLEESYGYVTISARELAAGRAEGSTDPLQSDAALAIDQHRSLYLHVVDLAEHVEELQYRGCDQNCLMA